MKKSTLFLSALMISALGFNMMTSCKDYEEDDFAELQLQQKQDGALIDSLKNQIVVIQQIINGTSGQNGKSAYDIWKESSEAKDLNGDGKIDIEDFLLYMKGTQGNPGNPGDNGKSAYQIWKDSTAAADLNGDGNIDEADFLIYMKGTQGNPGDNGKSAYDVWKESSEAKDMNNDGNIDEADYFLYLHGAKGDQGDEGKSAFDIWKDYMASINENTDIDGDGQTTIADMILWLKGKKGEDGKSAFDLWLDYCTTNGITKDQNGDGVVDIQDFFLYLKGEDGDPACDDEEACKNAQAVVYRLTNALIGQNGNLTDAQLDEFENAVKKALQDIKYALAGVEYLQDAMAKQVTGVIAQRAWNPVFGTFSTPFGFENKVLMSYYGNITRGFNFPMDGRFMTDDQVYKLQDVAGLTIDNFEQLSSILVDGKGNAGNLYLTVNPNTVDFRNLKVELVNSQDKSCPCVLEPLQKDTTTVLTFGYSRSANNNGFYSASATIDENAINSGVRFDFDVPALKESIKDIVSFRDGVNWTSLAQTVYNACQDVLDAEAVKVSWTDTVFNTQTGVKEAVEHAVYSNYDIAATAIKPLSYKTFEGFNYQHLPAYERASKALDQIMDKIMGVNANIDDLFNDIRSKINININFGNIDLGIDVSALVTLLDNTHIDSVHLMALDSTLLAKFQINDTITLSVDTTLFKENADIHDGIIVDFPGLDYNLKEIIEGLDITIQVPKRNFPIHDGNHPDNNGCYPGDNWYTSTMAPGEIFLDANNYALYVDSIMHLDASNVQNIKVDPINVNVSNVEMHLTYTYILDYDLRPAIQDLYNQMASAVDGINGTIGSLSDFMEEMKTFLNSMGDINDKINDALGNATGDLSGQFDDVINSVQNKLNNTITSYQNTASNIISRIQNLLDRVDSKVVGLINRANAVMQPTMIVDTFEGAKLCSSSRYAPTAVSHRIALYPTTYNAEVLTPAFKKYVVVTNVFNADDLNQDISGHYGCKSEMIRVNSHDAMNVVLPGYTRGIYNVELNPGYVYEISYLSVDFLGEGSNKVFYVKVK